MIELFFDLDPVDHESRTAWFREACADAYDFGRTNAYPDYLEMAAATGDLDVVRLVRTQCNYSVNFYRGGAMRTAAYNGQLHIVR